MKTNIFLLCAILLHPSVSKSQMPTDQDCLGAILLCGPIYTTANPAYGVGNYTNETGPGTCQVAGEINSLWLKFTIATSGDLAFTIIPAQPYDYDWALYDLTNASCADVVTNGSLLLSCNSSQYAVTGISSLGVGNWNGPGLTSAFNYLLPVVSGNTYFLQINNVNGVTGGFTIDFSASTATILDCDSVSFGCSQTSICEKFCTDFIDQSANGATSWQWIFPGGNPSSSTDQNPTNICYATPGTYDVTLITTNVLGNDTITFPDYITVNPTPPFPTITQTGYTLTSSPSAFYQWQLNTVDVPGATNQSYDIAQTGYYTVFVSDSNSCRNSTTLYVEITGISPLENQFVISVIPNPFSSSTAISFSLSQSEKISMIIYDVTGREVKILADEIMSEGAHQLQWNGRDENGDEVSEGIYFLQLLCKDSFGQTSYFSQSEKLILTR